MTIAQASTAVDTEKRYPAGTDTAKARAASGWREIVLAPGVAGVLASCKPKPPPGPPPTPEVTAIIVKEIEVPNVIELPGRIEAVRTAEVRARADGIVQRRLYQEGSDVRAGAQLFEIDPRDMRAALEAAEADLRRAEAARVKDTRTGWLRGQSRTRLRVEIPCYQGKYRELRDFERLERILGVQKARDSADLEPS